MTRIKKDLEKIKKKKEEKQNTELSVDKNFQR